MFLQIPVLLSFTVLATAQSLSPGCTNALATVAANPASACLSPTSLIPIITGSKNVSVVQPINNWLVDVCAAAPCSNVTLSSIITNITTGCTVELSSVIDASPRIISGLIAIVQQYYPTVRKVLCLKDSNTNCITQTLTNVEGVLGPLSVNNIIALATNSTVNNLPTNITCTNCVKAAYNIIEEATPSLVSDAIPAIQSQCGTSFTDGITPPGIVQSASNSTIPLSSTAAPLIGGLTYSVVVITFLFVVSTTYVLLA